MIRLSFIVPFYNVEPYIEECIRSLYNQDIPQEEYEVICIDDCSPDGSQAIVKRLQHEYPTLRLLVHTENKRQGGARNTGLKEAKGKYIWFVDSDDTIQSNCLKMMLEQAESEGLDILRFYFNRREESNTINKPKTTYVVDGATLIFDIQNDRSLIARCCSACQQLICKDLIDRNSITFAEHVQYEDDDFAYQIYANASRTSLIAAAPYLVRITPNSTTRRNHDVRRIHDIYAQALRMVQLDKQLAQKDERWHEMITKCIDDCINNCVFRMLNNLSIARQLYFWFVDRKHVRNLKPYLSRKSYAKLKSYILWRILQKR